MNVQHTYSHWTFSSDLLSHVMNCFSLRSEIVAGVTVTSMGVCWMFDVINTS